MCPAQLVRLDQLIKAACPSVKGGLRMVRWKDKKTWTFTPDNPNQKPTLQEQQAIAKVIAEFDEKLLLG